MRVARVKCIFTGMVSAVLITLFSLSLAIAESPTIVVILPLTGKLANIGNDLKNAVMLHSESDVAFRFEDDAFDPKMTATIVQQSIRDPSVKAFITFGSGTSLAAKALVERMKFPAIAIAMSEKLVQRDGSMFRYYLTVDSQAARLSKEIQQAGLKRPVFVISQQEAMLAFKGYFERTLSLPPEHYIDVVPGESDVRTAALRVMNLNPDTIVLLLLPPELSSFAKALRSIGYRGPFIGPTQLGNPDAAVAAQGALEGARFTGLAEAPAREMIEAFHARFGTVPTSEAIATYDAARLLTTAVRSGDVLSFLRRGEHTLGTFGASLRAIEPNTFEPPIVIKTIRGASFQED